jgi:hypothetical protein
VLLLPSTDSFPLIVVLMEPTLTEFVVKSFVYQILNTNKLNDNQELPLSNVKFPFAVPGYEAYPLHSCFMRPFPRIKLTEFKGILIAVCIGELLRVSWGILVG